jgi:hypothetical protein
MTLASTQPLTEMSTRNIPGGKERRACKADNLTASCEPRRLTARWAFTACYSDSFPFTFTSSVFSYNSVTELFSCNVKLNPWRFKIPVNEEGDIDRKEAVD